MRKFLITILMLVLASSGSLTVRAESSPGGGTPPPLSDTAKTCIVTVLGQDRLTAILAHTPPAPTRTEMDTIESCVKSTMVTPLPDPTTRMPQLDGDIADCVKVAIGEDAFALIMNGTVPPTADQQALMKACFSDVRKVGDDHHSPMSPGLAACLQQAVGSDRFTAISSGQSKPTDAEELAGKACFAKFGEKAPSVEANRKISDSVEQCLKLALGEQRYEAMKEGKAVPTLADRDAGQKCFGAPTGPMSPDIGMKMGAKLQSCLKDAVGEVRFVAISTGVSSPTDAERARGAKCFTKNVEANSSETVLPPAPQEVPFLPIKASSIDITKQQVVKKNGQSTLTVEGKGKPNSVVDIHIFSKGTTVSVQTDKKGNWKYVFNRKLDTGKHRIYATTRSGKQTVRSAAETVTVKK